MPLRFFHVLFLFLALAAPLIAAPRSLAQGDPVTVTATAPVTGFIGEDVSLQIIIRGSQRSLPPEIPASEDYTVVSSGLMTSFTNGSVMMAHTFSLRPKHTGALVVPPLDVTVNDKVYKTNEVRVNIFERPPSEFVFEVIPDKTRVYAGEPVRLRLAVREAPNKPWGNPRFSLGAPSDVELEPHPDQPAHATGNLGSPPSFAVPLDGMAAIGVRSREVINGVPGDYFFIDRLLIAEHPGRIVLDRARVSLDAAVREVGRSFFGDPQYQYQTQTLTAKPVTIEVLPLPTQGRPADFSGLIGEYHVEASVDQRTPSVGEPINLAVTVTGPPPISLVPSLDFSAQKDLARNFRVPRDPVLPSATGATAARFQQMIRARSADVTEVPPIGFNYFDTISGTYKLAQSRPIPIKVKPSTEVGMGDDSDDADNSAAPAKASAAVVTGPFAFDSDRFDLERVAFHPVTLALVGLPPLSLGAIIIALAASRRRYRLEPVLRRRRAVRVARRELDRIAAAAADASTAALGAGRALTNLAADWFGRPRQTLTSPEAHRLLATASSPAAAALAPVLAECDRVQFGGAPHAAPDPRTLLRRAREALAAADLQLREVAQ
jgi:hypothetical protein